MDIDVPCQALNLQQELQKPIFFQHRRSAPQVHYQSSGWQQIVQNRMTLAHFTRPSITIQAPKMKVPTLTSSCIPQPQVRPQIISRQQPPRFILPQVSKPCLPTPPSPRIEQTQSLPSQPARPTSCPSPAIPKHTVQVKETRVIAKPPFSPAIILPTKTCTRLTVSTPTLPLNAGRCGECSLSFYCRAYS